MTRSLEFIKLLNSHVARKIIMEFPVRIYWKIFLLTGFESLESVGSNKSFPQVLKRGQVRF